jgi:hypothetical protein
VASAEVVRYMGVRHSSRKNGQYAARKLRQWTKAFIEDQEDLPVNAHGKGNVSQIEDEDLKQEVLLHLQGIRIYVKSADIVDYMNRDDVKESHGLRKGVSLATAKRWM